MKIKSFMRLKLSNRLQRALDDLKAVEKDPKFVVDMGTWAAMEEKEADEKYCVVCHAGSVLAKSINGELFKKLMNNEDTNNHFSVGYDQLVNVAGEDPEVAEKFEKFMEGVNALRENELVSAAEDFGLPLEFFDKFKHGDKWREYEDDPKAYKKWFQLVINYVARQGK